MPAEIANVQYRAVTSGRYILLLGRFLQFSDFLPLGSSLIPTVTLVSEKNCTLLSTDTHILYVIFVFVTHQFVRTDLRNNLRNGAINIFSPYVIAIAYVEKINCSGLDSTSLRHELETLWAIWRIYWREVENI